MTAPGGKLSRLQERAIAALLQQKSIAKAAEVLGVGEKTLRRWLKLPTFKAAFAETRRGLVDDAVARLQGAAGAAVDTLVALLGSKDDAVRCRAATAIMDRAGLAADLDEVLRRVRELESRRDAYRREARRETYHANVSASAERRPDQAGQIGVEGLDLD